MNKSPAVDLPRPAQSLTQLARPGRRFMAADVRRMTPFFAASLVLGVLMTMMFRYQRVNPRPDVGVQMQQMVKYLEIERARMIADLQDTRDQLHKYEDVMSEKGSTLKLLKEELDKARMQAGLVPVKGPGLEVVLNDSPRKPGADDDPYFYIVHDVDIQAIVNELWAAGAEAISVNDQRVVTSTSVRCVGPTVLVNSVRLTPPYFIHAIGAPATLDTALKMPGGVMASLEASIQKGVRIDIQKRNELIIPEFKGTGAFRYAEPVDAK